MSDSPTAGLSPLMDMRIKLTHAEQEIERLENEHVEKSRYISELHERIAKLESACDRRRGALKQARNILDERSKRIAKLEAKLYWHENDCCFKDYEARIAKLEAYIDHLNGECPTNCKNCGE